MERAEPKLFNEYVVSNYVFILSDFLKLRTPGSEWIFIILFLSAFISDAKRDTLLAYHRQPTESLCEKFILRKPLQAYISKQMVTVPSFSAIVQVCGL